ncbi:MAG: 1,4-alpha-glucan branching protein GlgB [Simkaniaceae bacterium]|nr:MAG: 1,4-alpha-glucan branching protein GlgB [Simkaniaceae bacterium]
MERTNPHSTLGLHDDGKRVSLYAPGKEELYLEVFGKSVQAKSLGGAFFEYRVNDPITGKDYRITHPSGLTAHDPYAFMPTFRDEDALLFNQGKHWKISEVMGGRFCIHQEVQGVKFSVWAPHANWVSLVGDFNNWNHENNPMRLIGSSGVWELFVPGLEEGERYKFAIHTDEDHVRLKADPYGYQGEMRPHTASVVTRIDLHNWKDQEWMEKRKRCLHQPLNIYKLHIGCWQTKGGEFMNYRELAPLIVDYVKKMGFSHVELLPVMGHPLDESWGYQVTGFYAISRRYGTIEDFQWFVDYLHQNEVGLIFDWVPGHFPTDDHSIAQFDGTYLYEHKDPLLGYHPKWDTLIFNYGKPEVLNFLIGSALFYLEKMHLDGLRVDAVSSIIYLDFEREAHQWKPNALGGNENIEGISFLKQLNEKVHEYFPTALMMAEESHAYPGVTDPNRLGFDLRWDLGWSIDTLKFFETEQPYRRHVFKHLIHEMSYFYTDNHLLPLSHDDVTHERKSLLSKMPGTEWEQFANLRLLLSYMMTHPGKKLLFMGGELGQKEEWNCNEMLPWSLLTLPYNQGIQECVSALNHFYLSHPALYAEDFSKEGFEWIEPFDEENLVLSYLRRGGGETLLCTHHFSTEVIEDYFIPYVSSPKEIFSTDSKEYQGSGIINSEIKAEKGGIKLTLPPLATLILSL